MSRLFNGPTTADRVTFGLGSGGTIPAVEGPITMAALCRFTGSVTSGTFWVIDGVTSANGDIWGMLVDSNKWFIDNDFTAGGPTLIHNSWMWVAVTKATGSVKPRWHVHDLGAGTAWTHADGAGNVGNGSGTLAKIIVGGPSNTTANQTWQGEIAVQGVWNSVLSDAQIEAALTLAATDFKAATPSLMWRWNQASTATSVTDDMPGGANQTAISGTSVSASDPPGFNYSLSAPPSQGSAAFGLGMALGGTGARDSAGTAPFVLGLAPAAQGARTSAGVAALGLGMALAGTAARDSAGTAAGGLSLGIDVDGERDSAGSAAFGLSLGIDVDGERDSAGSAAFGLDLAPAATGARSSSGVAAFGLDLALAATGARESAGSATLGIELDMAASGTSGTGGSAAFTLVLASAADGARNSQGLAELGLGLELAATGARSSSGSAAAGLGLALGATGARSSSGSAAAGLGLALGATGQAPPIVPVHAGSAAFTLGLALAATGAAEVSCLPFPWVCSDVPEFDGCADIPAWPGSCVPVPSFPGQ